MTYLTRTAPNRLDTTPRALRLTSVKPLRPAQSFPALPGIADTAPLRHAISVMFAQLWTMFTPAKAARGTATHIQNLRRALYGYYKTERHNYGQCLLMALRASPVWQSQVKDDLGGDAAMTKWERRQERLLSLDTADCREPNHEPRTRKPRQERRSSGPLTDRSGLFRLAPVSRTPKPAKPRHGVRPPALHSLPFAPLSPRPLPITPDDLRPQAMSAQPERSNEPVPERRYMTALWGNLQMHLIDWNFQLSMADLAVTLPSLRADLAPP